MKSQSMRTSEYAIRLHTLYAGGLIAISLIVIQVFIGLGKLDMPALISVLAFASAIPLLSGMLVVNVVESKYQFSSPHSKIAKIVESSFYIGILINFVGIAAAFWHVWSIAGIVFIIMAILSGLLYSIYIFNLSDGTSI